MNIMKKIDEKNTLAYAVNFLFPTSGSVDFRMGNKIYQHISTTFDRRSSDSGWNTLEICYDYKAMRYVVFNMSDDKISNKEIVIVK